MLRAFIEHGNQLDKDTMDLEDIFNSTPFFKVIFVFFRCFFSKTVERSTMPMDDEQVVVPSDSITATVQLGHVKH